MADFKVTPWEVSGDVDYSKLTKEFGTSVIDNALKERIKKHTGTLHPMLRRNFYFSHRDLNLALDSYEKGKKFFLYTGRGPSGGMHLGHLTPLMFTQWLQEKFDVNLYIQITDDEKSYFKEGLTLEEAHKLGDDNILDVIACGFDPDKTFIFQDSEYSKIYHPSVRFAKHITFSTAKAVFGFTNESNIGSIFYPAVQSAPTLFEKAPCLIPCAIDQDPFWRIQRDVAPKLGYSKAAAIHSMFLTPLTGPSGKMSSSDPTSAIFLTDDEKTVKDKIMRKAFTGGRATAEEQRRLGANPDVCSVFQWLKVLFEDDDKKLAERYVSCKSGGILCGECKKCLYEKTTDFLVKHQKKREAAKKTINKFKYDGKLAKRKWDDFYA